MGERSGREQKNLWQSFPFGVPAAEAALMFLDHRCEHDGNEAGTRIAAARTTADLTGLRLCGKRGRSAAAGFSGLENFADFRLREQRNIARDFPQRANQQAERGGNFRETVAMRMPRNAGHFQF